MAVLWEKAKSLTLNPAPLILVHVRH